jgi:ATP-binding cassette subfamily C protein
MIFFLSLICGGIKAVIPLVSGFFLDALVNTNNKEMSYQLIAIFVVFTILNIFLTYFKNIFIIKAENKTVGYLINDLLDYLFHADYAKVKKFDSSYLTQRIYNDTKTIVRFIIGCLSTASIYIISSILSFVFLYRINFMFALITLISIPVYIVFIYILRERLVLTNFVFKENQDKYVSQINEQINLIEEIKINSLYTFPIIYVKKAFDELYNAVLKTYKLNYTFNSFSILLNGIIQVIFFVLGINLVFSGKLTIGMFSVINILYGEIIGSIEYFFDLIKQIQEIKVSVNRVNDLLSIPIEVLQGEDLNGDFSIKTEKSSYTFQSSNVLKFPSVKVIKNGIYLISGDNGTGKTTFLRIIVGLLKVQHSKIFYGDKDIYSLNIHNLRRDYISYVTQEPIFWNTSVASNFCVFLEKQVTYEYIKQKINEFGLNKFVNNLFFSEELWYKNINELSVGQKKKLMICIQLIRNKNVIILDEPNASLDEISIRNLHELIHSKKSERIIFIVSHDDIYSDISLQKISLV